MTPLEQAQVCRSHDVGAFLDDTSPIGKAAGLPDGGKVLLTSALAAFIGYQIKGGLGAVIGAIGGPVLLQLGSSKINV